MNQNLTGSVYYILLILKLNLHACDYKKINLLMWFDPSFELIIKPYKLYHLKGM